MEEESYNSCEIYNKLQLFSQYFLVTVNMLLSPVPVPV